MITGLVTVIGSYFVFANTNRELDIRMVNVALTILSAKDKGADTLQARFYALRALQKLVELKFQKRNLRRGQKVELCLPVSFQVSGDPPSGRLKRRGVLTSFGPGLCFLDKGIALFAQLGDLLR